MQILSPGVFQVTDGEVVTVNIQSTGAPTLFGVTFAIFTDNGLVTQGQPLQITMNKSRASGTSFVPNARSESLSLLFNFTSTSGGRYDLTTSGSGGGPTFPDHASQAGATPEQIPYTFHIV